MISGEQHLGDDDYGWFNLDEADDGAQSINGVDGSSGSSNAASPTAASSDQSTISALSIARAQSEHQASMSEAKTMGGVIVVQLSLVTRCLLQGPDTIAWTWGVGGHRLVRGRQCLRHIEYQIVSCMDETSWSSWRRFSKIAGFAEAARNSGAWCDAAQEAWDRVHGKVILRQFDPQSQRNVCILLQEFLMQYLFACRDLGSLLAFVGPKQNNAGGR